MLRISGGTAKNKKLKVPDIEGIRPVQEVVKLAVFSIIGNRIMDSACLDLYSGSGNLGLEALSRGAKWCDFVDEQWTAKKIITDNIHNCGFEDKSEVHLSDAVKYVTNTSNRYDIVFVDPFYETSSHKFLVNNLDEILIEGGYIFFLHGEKLNIQKLIEETNLVLESQRKYGKSRVSVLRHRK